MAKYANGIIGLLVVALFSFTHTTAYFAGKNAKKDIVASEQNKIAQEVKKVVEKEMKSFATKQLDAYKTAEKLKFEFKDDTNVLCPQAPTGSILLAPEQLRNLDSAFGLPGRDPQGTP